MKIIKDYSNWIQQKGIDHVTFLKNISLALSLIILIFYSWSFYLVYAGIISQEFFIVTISKLSYFMFIGLINGLAINFILEFPHYFGKEWDLHHVIPLFLIEHLTLSVFIFILFIYNKVDPIQSNSFTIGFLLGGLLTILAYAGEVKREHQVDDDPILLEADE
ncbi:MAG: hypothetical protein OEY49_08240 [Candidatus Heimdallarchaeota archaeon]|nr:hypothetical protein [Candidatus Heimdallarchaeota archaeon]